MGLLVLQPTKHHTKPKRCQTQPGTEVVRALGQSFPVVCRARWRPGCIQNAPRGRARRQAPWPPHRCARLPPASEHACRRSPPSLDLLCVGVACTLCHTSAMCVCVSVCVCVRGRGIASSDLTQDPCIPLPVVYWSGCGGEKVNANTIHCLGTPS